MKNFRKAESGQILIITALSMAVLLGFMAIAIDVGLLFNARRKLQNAVDAAATSGAIDYMFNGSQTSATAAATAALHANGFSVTPTVNYYPNITSTYHNNGDYYVQVIATVSDPTFFLGAFHGMFRKTRSVQESVNITGKAIAGMPGQGNACVIVLDPNNDSGAMTLQGSFNVDAGGCGVVVDSTSSDALQFTGAGGTLTAKYVSVVGGDGGQTGDSTPHPVTHAAPVNNPFPGLTSPPTSGANSVCTTTGGASGHGNTNSAQSYTGTSTIYTANGVTCFTYVPTAHGSGSSPVSLTGVTLPPGLAVFPNGVTLGGTISSGTGVNGTTLDVVGGQLSVSTNTNLALTAPTRALSGGTGTGAWSVQAGLAILQPSTNNNQLQLQTGSSCGTLDGIIYAPTAQLYLNDSGGDNCGGTGFGNIQYTTDLIVYQLMDKTATLDISNYNTSLGTSGPLTAVALVE